MKRKSRDNHHLEFFCLTSILMLLVWFLSKLWVFLKLRTWFFLTLYIWLFTVYATSLAGHLYISLKNFGYDIYLCFVHLSRYEIIIFECQLVTRSKLLIGRKQTSFFVKLLALSLLLVRIYWLDNNSPLLVCYWY